MTVSVTNASSGPYTGNGSATAFPFTFKALSGSEVVVQVNGAAISAALYSVSLGSSGGTVTFTTAPATGASIMIVSAPSFNQQDVALSDNGAFLPHIIEAGFDRAAVRDIYLKDAVSRSIQVDPGQIPPTYAELAATFKGDKGDHGSGNLIGFSVDDYCTVNTAAGNTAGLAALAAAVIAAGGGVIDFTPGKTYTVGVQTFHNPAIFTYYNWYPDPLLVFTGCTKPVIIRGNGAKLQCAAGLKYGTFKRDGTKMTAINNDGQTGAGLPGYLGTGLAIPYDFMLSFQNCTGSIHVEHLEMDGNINAATIGGGFSDTGIQAPMTGVILNGCTGGYRLIDVNSHHHGQDGIQINGLAAAENAYSERGYSEGCHFDKNCRLGMAFVGGRGHHFQTCTFNWNAAADAPGGGLPISSNPAAGIDFEAEAGRFIRDVTFSNCELIGNLGPQAIADSGGSNAHNRITFRHTKFVQTHVNAYVTWFNKPGFKLYDCEIVGTNVLMWLGDGTDDRGVINPFEALTAIRCSFSNSNSRSPTGVTGCINDLIFESGAKYVTAVDCVFEHDRPGSAANGNTDEIHFKGCTFIVRQAGAAFFGRVSGRTMYVNAGGANNATPGTVPAGAGMVGSTARSGHAEDPWYWVDATIAAPGSPDIPKQYPATIDKAGNIIGTVVRGDAVATLVAGTDPVIQRWTTTLTADRAVTLSTTGAGAGNRFRINRPAAGAFNLNVGTGPLKALAAAQWCEVEYDGAAWQLTASGSL